MMTGGIELAEQKGLTALPQRAASAWSAGINGICGADYKPLVFVGTQVVKGVNYWFIAEQKLTTRTGERHIVKLAINEFQNVYTLVNGSIERIF